MLTWIRVLSPIGVLALWQLGSALGVLPQDKLPAPSLIAEAGWEKLQSGELTDASSPPPNAWRSAWDSAWSSASGSG